MEPWLGPSLVARTVKKNRQLELTVLKQGVEQLQVSLSFKLEGLKETEMNAQSKQQHFCLHVHRSLLQNRPSKLSFFHDSGNKPKR